MSISIRCQKQSLPEQTYILEQHVIRVTITFQDLSEELTYPYKKFLKIIKLIKSCLQKLNL